jgi:hypothetical protein
VCHGDIWAQEAHRLFDYLQAAIAEDRAMHHSVLCPDLLPPRLPAKMVPPTRKASGYN